MDEKDCPYKCSCICKYEAVCYRCPEDFDRKRCDIKILMEQQFRETACKECKNFYNLKKYQEFYCPYKIDPEFCTWQE